jgi:hypothetical protein
MITWKITQLDRLTSDGFITTAHWTATAVDGDYTALFTAPVVLLLPSLLSLTPTPQKQKY